MQRPTLAGLLLVSLAGVLWGTTGPVVAVLHERTGLGALTIGFWRLVVSAAVMVLLCLWRWRTLVRALRAHPVALLVAGVGLAAYQGLYFLSVVWTGVSVATLVSLGLAPVVTAVWEAVRDRRRPTTLHLGVLVVALLGLALISLDGAPSAGSDPVAGLLAAIASGTVYAVVTLVCERIAGDVDGIVQTTVMSVVGAAALLPFALVGGITATAVDTRAALGLLYIGAVATALAYVAFTAGLRSTASSVASVLTLWEPITAALLAVLALAEPLGPLTAAGSGLLLLAVVVLSLATGRSRGRGRPAGRTVGAAPRPAEDELGTPLGTTPAAGVSPVADPLRPGS